MLGTLGGESSVATGLNNLGQVVGFSITKAGETHAFLWTSGEGMRDLGTLGGPYSKALGINDRGEVVGTALDQNGMPAPFVWDEEVGMRALPAAGAAEARGLNEDGVVIGVEGSKPVCWVPGEEAPRPLGHILLFGTPEAIASDGRIAGSSDLPSGGDRLDAVIWNPDGTLTTLGSWFEAGSESRDMNDAAEVVGLAAHAPSDPSVAVRWDPDGSIHDLNLEIEGGEALGSPHGWSLQTATGINERGDIVGVGVFGTRRQAFLLRKLESAGLADPDAGRNRDFAGFNAAHEPAPVRIVPNPSAGPVRIEFEASASGPIRIEIFAPNGRRIGVVDRSVLRGPVSLAWSPGSLPAGSYFVRAWTGGEAGGSASGRLLLLPR